VATAELTRPEIPTPANSRTDTGDFNTNPKQSLRDFESMLAPYRHPSLARSVWQVTSGVALYFAMWAAMYFSLSVSYWLTLALTIPTALLAIRIFVIHHDCGHRSLFKTKKANDRVGFWLGVLVFTPYHCWRREHAVHHANSGDLDRRYGPGEIYTMTVAEYRKASWKHRLGYRIYRNPFFLFGIGAFFHFVVRQRLTQGVPKTWTQERRSIHMTNLALLPLIALTCWLIGPWQFLLIQVPVMLISAMIGVWMFYVQHQYEDAFWRKHEEWDYVDAAIQGSSHYRLPKIMQWFTASIGVHHVHHLDFRIPNYNLQKCHDDNPEFERAVVLTFRESLSCMFLKLWDEDRKKLVTYKAARQTATA
jgi:omega-6 fatty acid desaturase (delta-12 desaturase)